MSFIVIDNNGALHVRDTAPTSAAITREVGEPGWDMVRTAGRTCGFVNDSGHLVGMPRNLVGSCLLASIGAHPMPYAGPVVITGWDPHDELVPLEPEQVAGQQRIHADIRIVLGLDQGTPSGLAAERWQRAMGKVAELVRDAPTPTVIFLSPGDPGWPF